MGRGAALKGYVRLNYHPNFIELFKQLTPEEVQHLDDIGRPKGYTAMNTYYFLLFQHYLHHVYGMPYESFTGEKLD